MRCRSGAISRLGKVEDGTTVCDFDPEEQRRRISVSLALAPFEGTAVDVAAATGWDAVGIWFDPASWTSATTIAVRRRLDASGITALDIEPVILGRDHDPGDALVDVAGGLATTRAGARARPARSDSRGTTGSGTGCR